MNGGCPMNTKFLKLALVTTSILGAAFPLAGCGKGPDAGAAPAAAAPPAATVSPVVATSGCTAGQFPLVGGCAAAFDFNTACAISSGYLTTTPQGTQVCRYKLTFNYIQGYGAFTGWGAFGFVNFATGVGMGFPRLSPSDVAGPAAFNTGIQVFPGDLLTFQANGGWGSSTDHLTHFLGGYIVSSSIDCNQVDLKGNAGTEVTTNQSQPAGLYGTDGTEVFPLPGDTQKAITHSGLLKFGFNAPNVPNSCSTLFITDFRIERCFDASGNTYPCQ